MKKQYALMGAICGDIVGSRWEWKKYYEIPAGFHYVTAKSRYTDDTALTVAIADAILHGGDYEKFLKSYTRKNPNLGFGGMFLRWALKVENDAPYGSYANGAAMRLSPVPLFYCDMDKVHIEAIRSTCVSHNHSKAIIASLELSTAIFLCRSIKNKNYIRNILELNYEYQYGKFFQHDNFLCKDSLFAEEAVNYALDCFFNSNSYEETIKTAVFAGGDTDTLAAIAGSIAFAYYEKMPQKLYDDCWKLLPLRYKEVIRKFDIERDKK